MDKVGSLFRQSTDIPDRGVITTSVGKETTTIKVSEPDSFLIVPEVRSRGNSKRKTTGGFCYIVTLATPVSTRLSKIKEGWSDKTQKYWPSPEP